MTYIDPKTGLAVSLPGTPGEQNLAANRAGYDFRPDTTPTPTPVVTGPTPEQTANAMRDAGLNPAQVAGVKAGTGYDPTIAGSGVRRYTGETPTSGTYDTEAAKLAALAKTPTPDEATIREQMRARVQEQIDAIKNTYTGLISAENVRGTGRLGSARAAAARSGTLGQDFGLAEKANVEQLNAEQVKALQNERDTTIAGILGKIDSEAYTRAQNAKVEAAGNSEKYLAYLKESRDQSRNDALTLAKSGASLTQLSDEQYKKLLDTTGYTPEQLQGLFTINKPQDQVLTSFTQGNQYIVVTQDPITKQRKTEKVDLGFTVPTEWKDTKLDDGSILFYNPKNPKDQQIYHPANVSLDYTEKSLRIQKLRQELAAGEPTAVTTDLQDAANAISQGADADKVRQRFLDKHPQKGDLYLKYTKQAY